MATFSELLFDLCFEPLQLIPGEEQLIHSICIGIPEEPAPNTIFVLNGPETEHIAKIDGLLGGIVSKKEILSRCPCAVFAENTDLNEVAQALCDALRDEIIYEEAKARLLSVFIEQGDLQSMVEEVHNIIRLPVTVFDLSTRVAAFAGEEQIKESGFRPALYVLDKGAAIGCTDEQHFNEQTRRFMDAEDPYVNTFDGGVSDTIVPRLCCRIKLMGEFAGHINIMGVGRSFRKSDFKIEKLLQQLTEKLWARDYHYCREPITVLLRDVYNGLYYQNSRELHERVRLLHLHLGYLYVFFLRSSRDNESNVITKSLINQFVNFGLGKWEHCTKYFLNNQGAFCLISLDECSEIKGLSQRLEQFLQRNDCIGGLSKMFTDIADFRTYCDQAQTLAEKFSVRGNKRLRIFESLYWEYVGNRIGDISEIWSVLCVEIQILARYDQEMGTQLVSTLRTYLECGGNSTESAKRLYVHRNTLIRRIKRIEELVGSNFLAQCNYGKIIVSAALVEHCIAVTE